MTTDTVRSATPFRTMALRVGSIIGALLMFVGAASAQGGSIADNLSLIARYYRAAMGMAAVAETTIVGVSKVDLSAEQRDVVVKELSELADAMDKMASRKQLFADQIKDYMRWVSTDEGKNVELRKRRFGIVSQTASDLQSSLTIVRQVLQGSEHLRPQDVQALREVIDGKDDLMLLLWGDDAPPAGDQLELLESIAAQDERLVDRLRKVSVAAQGTILKLRTR